MGAAEYRRFASQLLRTGILTDPWLEGRPRFRPAPVMLSLARARALDLAAESVVRVYDELVRLVERDRDLLESFFAPSAAQARMWRESAPDWHGIARADVFMTEDGPKVCEINSDTPSGEAEAVLINQLTADPKTIDPNATLEARFMAMVERAVPDGPGTVGIIYPTELVEDLSMILLYQRWFTSRGWRVVLGSPFNLAPVSGGGAAMFGRRCDLFIRHYKTDWWGERTPISRDEPPFDDPVPLDGPLAILLGAQRRGACAVINPFGALITQNKRSMALMWEALALFSPRAQDAIRAYVPYTVRLERIDRRALENRALWVLKSDYGCEGAEVVIGRDVSRELWSHVLDNAIPKRWIAQRAFEAELLPDGTAANYGVFVIGGAASAYFTRVQRGATDQRAVCAPTFIEEVRT